jgi:hypothetical protein
MAIERRARDIQHWAMFSGRIITLQVGESRSPPNRKNRVLRARDLSLRCRPGSVRTPAFTVFCGRLDRRLLSVQSSSVKDLARAPRPKMIAEIADVMTTRRTPGSRAAQRATGRCAPVGPSRHRPSGQSPARGAQRQDRLRADGRSVPTCI